MSLMVTQDYRITDMGDENLKRCERCKQECLRSSKQPDSLSKVVELLRFSILENLLETPTKLGE